MDINCFLTATITTDEHIEATRDIQYGTLTYSGETKATSAAKG